MDVFGETEIVMYLCHPFFSPQMCSIRWEGTGGWEPGRIRAGGEGSGRS